MNDALSAPPWDRRRAERTVRLLSKLQGFTQGKNGWGKRPCPYYEFRAWFALTLQGQNIRMRKILHKLHVQMVTAGYALAQAGRQQNSYMRRAA